MNVVRNWLQNRLSKPPSRQTAHTAETDLNTRTDRADRISELQATISGLQQERLTLSQSLDDASGTGTGEANNKPMQALEQQLDEAQRELGKIQGRI